MANSIKMSIELDGKDALKTIQALNKGLEGTGDSAQDATKKASVFGDVFKANLGSILAVNFGQKLAGQFQEAIQAFLDLETGLVNTAKTANLTAAEMEQLSDNVANLAKTIPATKKEFLEITTAAGQLGVKGVNNLTKFAETIAKLGRVSNLSGDEAATSLTRILNVTREGIDDIDVFASGIVALGNNFAATEQEIALVTNEVARASAQFGVSAGEAAALSATLRSFGVRAEEAGTVVGKTFRSIQNAIDNGGKSLKALEEITGTTGAVLKKEFGENAVQVLQKFLQGTQRLSQEGASLSQEFERIGLTGERVQKVIPTLAANYGELERAIQTYNEGSRDATALNEEFEKSIDTTSNKIQLLKNALQQVADDGFSYIKPTADDALDIVTAFIQQFQGSDLEKAQAKIRGLEATIRDVGSTTDAVNKFIGEDSFIGKFNRSRGDDRLMRLNEELRETQKLVEDLQPLDPSKPIKKLEAELATLKAENEDPILGSILGTKGANEERIKQIEAQLENLRNIKKLHNEELGAIDEENDNKEAERVKAQFDLLNEIKAEQKEFEKELKGVEEEEKLEQEAVDFEALQMALGEREAIKEIARINEITNEKKQQEALKKLRDKAIVEQKKKDDAAAKAKVQFDAQIGRQRVSIAQNTSALITEVLGSENKAAFIISKAAALAQVAISRGLALAAVPAQTATIPYPANLAAAAQMATLINVNAGLQAAVIAASTIKGFQDGGIVGGTSQTGDMQLIRANKGERILTARENRVLTEAIDDKSLGGGEVNVNITNPMFLSEEGVDEVIDQINDAIEFRNKELRV